VRACACVRVCVRACVREREEVEWVCKHGNKPKTRRKAGSGLTELTQSFDEKACRAMETGRHSLRATAHARRGFVCINSCSNICMSYIRFRLARNKYRKKNFDGLE
jgi:hypothetical protein